jgi:hypothetical protein
MVLITTHGAPQFMFFAVNGLRFAKHSTGREAAMRSRTYGSAAGVPAPTVVSTAFRALTTQTPELLTMRIVLEGEA